MTDLTRPPFRLAWATDVHLNFASPQGVARFLDALRPADGILLTGDLAEAHDVEAWLRWLATEASRPIWFVLGNHDFYGGTIAEVRARMCALTAEIPQLRWLSATGVTALTERVGLVGHDGWGDARHGDFLGTRVRLNDHLLIGELARLPREVLQRRLRALGDEAAAHLRRLLPDALGRFEQVLVATHVPPFVESCWHEGRTSDVEWLADFTCKAVGDVLIEAAERWPHRQILVLCGHTHGSGQARIRPNLEVWTGGAEYGAPALQQVLELAG